MKRFFATLLAALMLVSMIPVSVSAEEPPVLAQIVGGNAFANVQAAINAAGEGATVKLLANVTLLDGLEINADDKLTLDLAGFTLSYPSSEATGNAAITNRGELTIMTGVEGGKITYSSTAPSAANAYATNAITNNGKLTLVSGTIENTTTGAGGASYAIDNNSTLGETALTINGGEVKAVKSTIRLFANHSTASNNLTINGGKIEGTYAFRIQLPGNKPAEAPKVEVKVTGGEMISTDYFAVYSYSGGNSYSNVKLDITGGTFEGAIAVGGGSANGGEGAETLNITGGTFYEDVYTYNSSTEHEISISGGSFYVMPEEDYLADGFILKPNGNDGYDVGSEAHTIIWMNGDEEISRDSVLDGAMPEYTGATPTKSEDDLYTYEFAGWTPEIVAATADATYTATFKAVKKPVKSDFPFIVTGVTQVKVIDAETEAALEGATFELYRISVTGSRKLHDTYTSNATGRITARTLSPRFTYELVMTAAPEGYDLLETPVIFKVQYNRPLQQVVPVTKTVVEEAPVETPAEEPAA